MRMSEPTRSFRSFRAVVAALVLSACAALPLAAQSGDAETGRVIGKVVDAESARPLSGAQVFIPDTDIGALADLNGRYVLSDVPTGTHTVQVQMLGYGTKSVTDVQVTSGTPTTLDISVEQTAVELEGITVSAERERGSTAFLMDQRRQSNALTESVGAAEISRRPDSDAADVARRMTGVTVTDGKYVFVRGLGERYSQTQFNGSSLPSPEPEREVVPLDLFPAGFLESMETQKSYTPNLPADFSGGSVQINTKDFPNELTVKVGVSTSFNTESQFRDGFLDYPGGGRDFTGFDDGTRDQPEIMEQLMGGVRSGQRLPSDPEQRVAIGRALAAMATPFAPTLGDTPMNRAFDLSVGGRTDVRDEGELGFFVAGTYSDKYTLRDDETERKWRTDAFDPAVADLASPNVDYDFNRGTRAVSWGTIGNLTFKPNPSQKIGFRTTINLSTEDEARTYRGNNNEDIGSLVQAERSRFIERLMLWGQLSGEHRLFDDQRLDWRLSVARANRDEPALRESIFVEDDDEFVLLNFTESGRYLWTDLVDDDVSGAVDYRIPFGFFGEEAAVKFGGEYRKRDRDFGARRLNWRFVGNSIKNLDEALRANTIVARNPARDELALDEVVEPGDVYQADDQRAAGYLMFEVPVTDRLQAIVGARVEDYSLGLDSRGESLQELDQTDLAPSLNLIYSLSSQVKVRGAFSRTVDRPEFRELAPFQFTEATSLRQLFGNPLLESAEITNADLRVDWYPAPGELVSFGGYWKEIDDPIEQVFIAAASSAYSYQNGDEATLFGLELELQTRLDRLHALLRDVSFQGNYSWIDSEVTVRRGEGAFDPTNLERPLEGQAEYVLNLGLNYAPPSGIEAGVFFNRFGERLEAAGGSGVPDIFEMPRNSLDATLSFPVRGGARARIKGTNLLDDDYLFQQSANGITRLQRRYTVGRTFSVGLTWEL